MSRIFCFLLSIFFIGCDSPRHFTLVVDSSVTAQHLPAVLNSLDRWVELSEGNIVIDDIEYTNFTLNKNTNIEKDKIKVYEKCHSDFIYHGYADWSFDKSSDKTEGAVIWLNNESPNDHVYTILLHEFGHAFNLNHSDESNSIMNQNTKNTNDITCNDKKRFCEIWDCQVSC